MTAEGSHVISDNSDNSDDGVKVRVYSGRVDHISRLPERAGRHLLKDCAVHINDKRRLCSERGPRSQYYAQLQICRPTVNAQAARRGSSVVLNSAITCGKEACSTFSHAVRSRDVNIAEKIMHNLTNHSHGFGYGGHPDAASPGKRRTARRHREIGRDFWWRVTFYEHALGYFGTPRCRVTL
ncbi:uncharacterized protein K489DRAFT_160061 [Dissoconium aciculare CBS 342.82]|uniref:Uncharacterized protein n=1 Tax=Dissoconium aciculare CBS 342.82 TaxID=1314786 RepID=A0A6J3MBY7_9PEZI|nr:uncharacterized protein K489DRAFT_160061 [Dissoconium aciculare CBS 342.82]KAF1825520.1 hypothetical protein K489DRAFT_160061 [Dissoconium aciculare CBS 342.82]